MPYRVTLTVNSIPLHSKGDNYHSTRLTVFLFGVKGNIIEDLKTMLYDYLEETLDYKENDWWGTVTDFTYSQEITECKNSDAKGLGFYRTELSMEDNNGVPYNTLKLLVQKRKWGEITR